MVLKRSAQVVSVATLRVFGTRFAELPFVATRQGHRRAGNCRLLVQVREGMELTLPASVGRSLHILQGSYRRGGNCRLLQVAGAGV